MHPIRNKTHLKKLILYEISICSKLLRKSADTIASVHILRFTFETTEDDKKIHLREKGLESTKFEMIKPKTSSFSWHLH